MKDLTDQQSAVLDFIRAHVREKQYAPSVVEISRHFGWKSANAASCHLKHLERKGQIKVVPNIARGIQLTGSAA